MLKPLLMKTFGGLNLAYYLRNFVFGAVICGFFIFMEYHTTQSIKEHSFNYGATLYFIVCTFLYPYSRFVYESIINFIVGDNLFLLNALVLLIAKLFTMILCWGFAVFIAPIGLTYLYYYHTKNEKNLEIDN